MIYELTAKEWKLMEDVIENDNFAFCSLSNVQIIQSGSCDLHIYKNPDIKFI